jgi:hypothetical protein
MSVGRCRRWRRSGRGTCDQTRRSARLNTAPRTFARIGPDGRRANPMSSGDGWSSSPKQPTRSLHMEDDEGPERTDPRLSKDHQPCRSPASSISPCHSTVSGPATVSATTRHSATPANSYTSGCSPRGGGTRGGHGRRFRRHRRRPLAAVSIWDRRGDHGCRVERLRSCLHGAGPPGAPRPTRLASRRPDTKR